MASLDDTVRRLDPSVRPLVRQAFLPAARQLTYAIETQSTSPEMLDKNYGVFVQAYFAFLKAYNREIGKAENIEAVDTLCASLVSNRLQGIFQAIALVKGNPGIKDTALVILETELSKLVEGLKA